MRLLKERAGDRIIQLGRELFGVSTVDETIDALKVYFKSLGSPVTCLEAGIDESKKEEILNLMNRDQAEGTNFKLSDKDRELLLAYMY
jgi:alcohol dehydrogenase YqhD (iron-dependent ADH family)